MQDKNTFSKYFNDRFIGRVDADHQNEAMESLLEDVNLPKDHLKDAAYMTSNWTRNIKYKKTKGGNDFEVVLN